MWATKEADLSVAKSCLWPIVGDCTVDDTLSPTIIESTQQAAIDILHAASGRQFGECVVTYQPCRRQCGAPGDVPLDLWAVLDIRHASLTSVSPWNEDAYYATMVCSNCSTDDCGCVDLVDLELWHRSISSILEVVIDGVTLDPSNYRLYRGRLIRTDGEAWPECQDGTVALGEVGTWSVSYRHGRPAPAGGQLAAGMLACELAKAACGDTSCALPKRVQTVTRQGVTVGFLDPMQFLADGKTGLYQVDLWLQQVNPHRLQRRARAYSVASRRRSRTRVPDHDPFSP